MVPEAIGGEVLQILGITLEDTRAAVAAARAKGGAEEQIETGEIIPTTRVKRVIEHALENARSDERETVDTGDLLVGLLVNADSIATRPATVVQILKPTFEDEIAGRFGENSYDPTLMSRNET